MSIYKYMLDNERRKENERGGSVQSFWKIEGNVLVGGDSSERV